MTRRQLAALAATAVLFLTACSGDDDSPEPTPSSTAAQDRADEQKEQIEDAQDELADKVEENAEQAEKDAEPTVDITISDATVSPQGGRVEVKVGDEVTLRVSSDAPDELHVHSDPEHSFAVEPGDDQVFSFTVETPGQVAVELHDLGVTVVQLVVRP